MADFSVRRSPVFSLLQAAIGWTTLCAVAVFALPFGGNAPGFWVLFVLLIIVLFVAQLSLSLFRGVPNSTLKLSVPAFLYVSVVGWGFLQTSSVLPEAWAHPFWQLVSNGLNTVSADPLAGVHLVMRLTAYAMVFWIALHAAINVDRAMAFLKAFSLFSLALACFGLAAVFTGSNFVLQEQATNNVSATFINRNTYATYAVFGLITNLGVYMELLRSRDTGPADKNRDLRNLLEGFFSGAWIYAFGVVMCFAALLLTASRAGTASGFAAIITFLALFRAKQGRNSVLILSAVISLGAFAATLSETVLNRLFQSGEESRFIIYREMIAAIGDRLWLGHGLGAFQDTFRPFVPFEVANLDWDLAHSSYLENLWELGLPATLVFYGALLWLAAGLLYGNQTRQRNRVYSSVGVSCVVAAALHSLVDFSLQIPAVSAAFAFILGIAWAHAWPSRSTR